MSRLDDRYLCVDGRTPSGRRLQVYADSSFCTTLGTVYPRSTAAEVHVLIDGREWAVARWDTMRDGGTQTLKLISLSGRRYATLTLPHRLSSPDRIPRLDGEDVYERTVPWERYEDVIAWRIVRRVQYERMIRRVARQESGYGPGVRLDDQRDHVGLFQMAPPVQKPAPMTPAQSILAVRDSIEREHPHRPWLTWQGMRDLARRHRRDERKP